MHLSQDESGGLTVWEDVNEIFHGKAQAFIEGYRVVPEGATWVRFDGAVFVGLMISPAIDYAVMEAAQAGYDQGQAETEAIRVEAEDMRAALSLLGVTEESNAQAAASEGREGTLPKTSGTQVNRPQSADASQMQTCEPAESEVEI